MIDNPDGTRRLPTKEEILENVRQRKQRFIQSDSSGNETTIRTNNNSTTEDRRFFDARRGTSSEFEGRDRIDEGNQGSGNGTNGRIFGNVGTFRNLDSSTNEYSEPVTTATTNQRQYATSLKPSKFKPYADAVKQAFKGQSKEAPKTVVAKKVLTKQEANDLKEKLIEVLLWQSDHADEFIIGTTKGHAPVIIWSDLDKNDATIIANFMLERAKTDKQMAYIVREMVGLKDKIQLALIILPRLYRTLMVYLERGIGIR